MRAELLNGGAYSRAAFQAINKTLTAAGAGDNTEVNGDYVSRRHDDYGLAMSAKLVITWTTTLETDETLSFAVQFQDASDADGTGVADYGDAVAAEVVATGDSGGSTVTGVTEVDISLAGAKEFIRAQITPDLSRGATDTAEWSAAIIFFGDQRQPSTGAIDTVGVPT